MSFARTTRDWSSSSSTACRMTCCRTRCEPAACRTWLAGSGQAPTSSTTGTRCCHRRRRPARQASCMATTTASRTSAGGRRRTVSCWWPTIPRMRPRSSKRISNGEGLAQPGRREHQQHLHGRWRSRLPGDVHDQGQGARARQERCLRLVLRQPVQLHDDAAQVPRRGRQGEHPEPTAGCVPASGRTWATIAGFPVPVGARRHERRASGAGDVARRPGDDSAARPSSTWTTPTTTRSPTTAVLSAPNRLTRSTVSTGSCGRCARPPEDAARPYRFVILADHGQSLGATFLQRYGVTLQDVVRSLMGGKASVAAATAQIEDWGQLNTFLGEVSKTKGITGSARPCVSRDAAPRTARSGWVRRTPR